jgi:acyl transferase domain-containing protein
VLVVKSLSKALADGDPIRAVVRATGTNQVSTNKQIKQLSKISIN